MIFFLLYISNICLGWLNNRLTVAAAIRRWTTNVTNHGDEGNIRIMDFVYDGKRTHGVNIKGGAMRFIYSGGRGWGTLVLMNCFS